MNEVKDTDIELDCSGCSTLTSIPLFSNLTELGCSFCPNLTLIPLLPNLTKLDCSDCALTSIPLFPDLTELYCWNCPGLTFIPLLPELIKLKCSDCPNLISVSRGNKLKFFSFDGCPWLVEENIYKAKYIQSFIRKNLKYFRFKNWIKSEEGIKWIYNPEHLGGWYDKKQGLKMFML